MSSNLSFEVGEFVLLRQELAGRWLIKWEGSGKVNPVVRPRLVPSLSCPLPSQLQPLYLGSHLSPSSRSAVLQEASVASGNIRQILKPPPQMYRIRNPGDGPRSCISPSPAGESGRTPGLECGCSALSPCTEQVQKISSADPQLAGWF